MLRTGPQMLLLHRAHSLQEALGIFTVDGVNVADLATELHPVALVFTLNAAQGGTWS